MALERRGAALAVKGVSKSGGAGRQRQPAHVMRSPPPMDLPAATGAPYVSFSVSAIAGEGTAMERDYDFSAVVHAEDLQEPEDDRPLRPGERAVRRLKPRKVKSQAVPVIYDRRVAASLVGHLIAASMGSSIARGTSFLRDKLGQQIFPSAISIIDDPFRRRGLASRPFDAEGIARRAPLPLIEDGVLTSWILDLHSARQLGLAANRPCVARAFGPARPSSTNVHLAARRADARGNDARRSRSGLYVTELIGQRRQYRDRRLQPRRFRLLDREWRIAFPVSEVTIAGKLPTCSPNLTPPTISNSAPPINAPTCRVEGMTIAGR